MMIVVKVILVGLYMKDLWYCVYVFYFYFMCFYYNIRCELVSFFIWKNDWFRLVIDLSWYYVDIVVDCINCVW